jgi:class 3 adenylate cyclase/tetratricopeptide (TPR) repeat protein
MATACARCAMMVPDGAKFCGECGAPALSRCRACGMIATSADQRFCQECGQPLALGVPAPATGESSSGSRTSSVERRQVSVLFADLTGFTAFSERRDAEDVREMLSEYFDHARRIVDSYGGRVDKFIGDAVMALWGAPVANEDDAERAVRAALDLVAAVTALGDRLGVELRVRIGVLTGQAAVELDAVAEGMVIGDAINTASRIQSVAEPGTVLVDEVTRAVTGRAIAYEDGGAHEVKGKTDLVQTWRALRVIAAVGGAGRVDLELPLVGRAEEMSVIRQALDDVISGHAGLQLVTLIGQPGLGKSRLAWEFKKYADGLATSVLWHHGQALSFGQGVGLSALAEMVRMRAQIGWDEPATAQRPKLHALVHELVTSSPNGDKRARVLRGLERLLGLDDGGQAIDLGELFSSWRTLFERLAARAPVVLLFEDLHWADQGLFDFIAHLCEWGARSRILVLVLSRPDERLETFGSLGERIDLVPLSDDDIEKLVAAAVDRAPEELVTIVRQHAAGVPLFAVESLRMLTDQGVMIAEDVAHRYRLVGDVHDLDVPPSIQALVAARLDRLGGLEREMLRGGAIFGQRFNLAAAAAVAGVGAADARSLLDGLVAKQFLAVDSDPRSQSYRSYGFVHRQVQRVVLDTLSRRERKARHLSAAECLTRQGSDPDLAAILAGHLVAACEARPDDADTPDIRRRALRLTLDAAQRADGVGALNEAVELYAQAARIEPDPARRAGHLVRAARCAERYGGQERVAADHYAAARALHEQAGRTREALRLRARELYVYRWSRSPEELIGPLREIYDAVRGDRDAVFADTAASLAAILYADGSAEAAEWIAAEAAEAAERAGAYEELGLALNCRASALIELARPMDALPLFQSALEIKERYAPSDVSASLGNIAVTLTALGRFTEAVAAGREAMAAGERLANRVHRNTAALYLARALFSLGRWDEATATVAEVAPETAPANRGMMMGPPVLVAIYRGERERARSVIDDFDRSQAESGAAFESDYRSLREVARAHLAGDRLAAQRVLEQAQPGDYGEWPTWLTLAVDLLVGLTSDEPLRDAVAALERDGVPRTSPMVTAQSARLRAHLAARARDMAAAASWWSTAIRTTGEAGMAFDEATLRVEWFEHVSHEEEARDGVHSAIATLAQLGATPWLGRARDALATSAGSVADQRR